MFKVRRTMASFEPGECEYPEHFQGSTILFPIIMPPLPMAPPAGVAQAPSMTPVPNPQNKRVIHIPQVKKLATKKPKVSTPVPLIDLIIEVKHQILVTTIVEEIPNTSTTTIHLSWESSPQTTSTSTTIFELFPFDYRRISVEAEVQTTGWKEGATSTLGMLPTKSTTPMLGLDPLNGRCLDTSW